VEKLSIQTTIAFLRSSTHPVPWNQCTKDSHCVI